MLNNDMIGLFVIKILKYIIILYFTLKYYFICLVCPLFKNIYMIKPIIYVLIKIRN